MTFTRTHADETVSKLYQSIGINRPPLLNPDTVAHRLGIELNYLPVDSMRINKRMYLDSRLSTEEQWQQFGHELCHVLWHQDNQLKLSQSFIDMQERQADNFALYACIPTDALLSEPLPSTEWEAVAILVETFGVTPEFALKRLKLHLSHLYQTTY